MVTRRRAPGRSLAIVAAAILLSLVPARPASPATTVSYRIWHWNIAGNVCAGTAYGIALFSRFPLGTTERYTLPSDGQPKARKLLCAPVKATPRVRFCTTHITTVQSYRQSQLDYVRGVLDGYRAAGGTVLIAGDFNVQPHEAPLDPWYVPAIG